MINGKYMVSSHRVPVLCVSYFPNGLRFFIFINLHYFFVDLLIIANIVLIVFQLNFGGVKLIGNLAFVRFVMLVC